MPSRASDFTLSSLSSSGLSRSSIIFANSSSLLVSVCSDVPKDAVSVNSWLLTGPHLKNVKDPP